MTTTRNPKKESPNGFTTRLAVGFIIILIIVIAIQLTGFVRISKLESQTIQVNRTHLIINKCEEIQNDLREIESSGRGYLITLNKEFIQENDQNILKLNDVISMLGELISVDSAQVKNFDQLKKACEQKIAFTEKLISLANEGKQSQALQLVASGYGAKIMAIVDFKVNSIKMFEERTLQKKIDETYASAQTIKSLTIAGAVTSTFLILLGFIYVFKETKKRAALKAEIEEQERLLFTFLNNLPLGIIIVDHTEKIVFTNTITKNLLKDVKAENMDQIRRSFTGKVSGLEKYPSPDQTLTAIALQGKSVYSDNYEIMINDRSIPFEIYAEPICMNGDEVNYAIIAFNDISTRKSVQNELLMAKAEAEKAVEMKDRFVANISHEIRTPMNAILGFSNLLLQEDNISEEHIDYITTIRKSAENLLNIINDILDFSKIEAGMMRIEKTKFSIKSLTESIGIMLRKKAEEKGLKLNFEFDEKIPEFVYGDPTRLTQILVNLIGNAIKFTSQGGVSVTIKKKEINVYEIHIEDTGIGIPVEKHVSIFNRFSQANDDTTRKFGGTGLGLSIVKNLVEIQNGSITLNSAPGEGSEFIVSLPYEDYDIGSCEDDLKDENFSKDEFTAKVLLVEDNQINQKLGRAVLSKYNFKLAIANHGEEAVNILKTEKFDLVIMDIQMPVMDGYTAAQYIRKNISKTIPIIAMTAHAMAGEREKCLSYGMNEYISKPFEEQDLIMKMRKLLKLSDPSALPIDTSLVNDHNSFSLDYIKSLSENPEFIQDMVNTFLTDVPSQLRQLEDAISKKDFPQIKASSHKLKTNFRTFGLNKIGDCFEKMESYAINKQAISYSSLFEPLKPKIEQVYNEAKKLLEKL